MDEKLLLITNRTREAAFSSLREVKRLLFLSEKARMGGLQEEILQRKKKTRELFRKWKALSDRIEKEKNATPDGKDVLEELP